MGRGWWNVPFCRALFTLFALLFVGRVMIETGADLNAIAVARNGHQMPMDFSKLPPALQERLYLDQDGRHKVFDAKTKMPWLCDWIPVYDGMLRIFVSGVQLRNGLIVAPMELRRPQFRPIIASPGDIVAYLGFWTVELAYSAVWIFLFLRLGRWGIRKYKARIRT